MSALGTLWYVVHFPGETRQWQVAYCLAKKVPSPDLNPSLSKRLAALHEPPVARTDCVEPWQPSPAVVAHLRLVYTTLCDAYGVDAMSEWPLQAPEIYPALGPEFGPRGADSSIEPSVTLTWCADDTTTVGAVSYSEIPFTRTLGPTDAHWWRAAGLVLVVLCCAQWFASYWVRS